MCFTCGYLDQKEEYSGWSEIYSFTTEAPVSVKAMDSLIPRKFQLRQNYPNPFTPVTTIKYGLPAESRIKLVIYDISGKLAGILADGYEKPGFKETTWNAGSQASGNYFVRLIAEPVDGGKSFTSAIKIILLK